MDIKQSVINTFNRVGIDYKRLLKNTEPVEVYNRFGGGSCKTTKLIASLIDWIYLTNNAYERGEVSIKSFIYELKNTKVYL